MRSITPNAGIPFHEACELEEHHGPRRVGGIYLSGYWGEQYEVLDLAGYSVRIRWVTGPSKGQERCHSTGWCYSTDRVCSQPGLVVVP
jgi:hypothetical protein